MRVSERCGSQTICNVLEIRLCPDSWAKVREVAELRGVSFSGVVRGLVFRMIRRRDAEGYVRGLRGYGAWEARAKRRRGGSAVKHRHMMTLYGKDELFIRLTAARFECTMTHLVRVAIEKGLDQLLDTLKREAAQRAQRAFSFWLGIKTFQDMEFRSLQPGKMCFLLRRFTKSKYT